MRSTQIMTSKAYSNTQLIDLKKPDNQIAMENIMQCEYETKKSENMR